LGGLGGMMRQIGASMTNWEAQKKEAQQKALEIALKQRELQEQANYRTESLGLQRQQLQQQQTKDDFARASGIAEMMGPGTPMTDPATTDLLRKQGFGSLITPGRQDVQVPIPNIRGISAPTTVDMPDRWQGVMPPQLRAQLTANSRLTDQFEASMDFKLQQLQQMKELAEMRGDVAGIQAAAALINAEVAKMRGEQSGKMTPFQVEQAAREYADSIVPADARGKRDAGAWNEAYINKKRELATPVTTSGLFGR